MSATEIMKELSKLTEGQRQRALQLKARIDALEAELNALVKEPATECAAVDLRARGIGEAQADDLRARLKTFAEDWDRPEASIYDEDPAR